MGDSIGYVLAVLAPGMILLLAGVVLTAVGRPSQRRGAARLFYFGFGLMYVVPGIAGVIAVVTGYLMWPAVFAALFSLLLGFGVFYGLRIRWAEPTAGATDLGQDDALPARRVPAQQTTPSAIDSDRL